MEYDNLSDEEIRLLQISEWKGRIVKHFKGDFYLILDANVIHSETNERMVCYKALYGDCQVYVRPAKMFIEECTPEQFKKYGQRYRFELLNLPSQKEERK